MRCISTSCVLSSLTFSLRSTHLANPKDERHDEYLPLFNIDIELPGSHGTLDQCRLDFHSLLIEISSLNVHNGPLSELGRDDHFRRLFEALQGWCMSVAAIFEPTFETGHRLSTDRRDLFRDRNNPATAHPNLSVARRLNMSLASLLDNMWALARKEDVGQAMLWVIVRGRDATLHSFTDLRYTQHTHPEDLVPLTIQSLSL